MKENTTKMSVTIEREYNKNVGNHHQYIRIHICIYTCTPEILVAYAYIICDLVNCSTVKYKLVCNKKNNNN